MKSINPASFGSPYFSHYLLCFLLDIDSHAPLWRPQIAIHTVGVKAMASQLRPRALNATAFSTASTSSTSTAAATTSPSAAIAQRQRRPRIAVVPPSVSIASIAGARADLLLTPLHRRQRRCVDLLVPTAVPILSAQSGDDDIGGSGGGGPEDKPARKFSHRWQVVFMMALAFVLCNMDKVR